MKSELDARWLLLLWAINKSTTGVFHPRETLSLSDNARSQAVGADSGVISGDCDCS